MTHERQLPIGDRPEEVPQGRLEKGSDYFKRILREEHGLDVDQAGEKARPWRRWMGQPSVAECIDRIFDATEIREPGQEG